MFSWNPIISKLLWPCFLCFFNVFPSFSMFFFTPISPVHRDPPGAPGDEGDRPPGRLHSTQALGVAYEGVLGAERLSGGVGEVKGFLDGFSRAFLRVVPLVCRFFCKLLGSGGFTEANQKKMNWSTIQLKEQFPGKTFLFFVHNSNTILTFLSFPTEAIRFCLEKLGSLFWAQPSRRRHIVARYGSPSDFGILRRKLIVSKRHRVSKRNKRQ